MAAPRYGHWVNDMAPGHRGPSTAGALMLFVVVGLVLWALLASPWATAESGRAGHPPTTPPACAQHMPPTCEEAADGRP
jgi:hypothetical protein